MERRSTHWPGECWRTARPARLSPASSKGASNVAASCFRALNLPARLRYALDRAAHAVFCREHACAHYGEELGGLEAIGVYLSGWLEGIRASAIPERFR